MAILPAQLRAEEVPRALLQKSRARKQRPIHHPSQCFGTLGGMGDLLGYARVSTAEQKAHLQTDALKKAGCTRVWTDKASGALDHRPKLDGVLDHLRPGDTLVVWRLDRLGRNLRHLIATVNDLAAAGIGFRSLTEGIDTTTSAGRLVFHMFGALAEFERELIRERTAAGLVAARVRGRSGGRPRVMTPEKLAVARQMYDSRRHTLATIATTVGVSRSTLYRQLASPAPGV
jgi:DNA invertase Pin-like site-specific DNA recombinase